MRTTPLPAVCFTCGAPAHMIIHLPNGCAALRGAQGYFGICPQHAYSIEPIEPYTVITTGDEGRAAQARYTQEHWAP